MSVFQTEEASLGPVTVPGWNLDHKGTAPGLFWKGRLPLVGAVQVCCRQTPVRMTLSFLPYSTCLADYMPESVSGPPRDLMWKTLPCAALLQRTVSWMRRYLWDNWLCCAQASSEFLDLWGIWTALPLELGTIHRAHPSSFHCLDLWSHNVGLQPAYPLLWDRTRLQFLFVLIRKDTNHRAYFVSYKGLFSGKANGIFPVKSQGEIGISMIYVKCCLGLSFDCSRWVSAGHVSKPGMSVKMWTYTGHGDTRLLMSTSLFCF